MKATSSLTRYRAHWLDAAWVAFSVANLCAIMWFANWETVPFHCIWISFTVIYGFRIWPARLTMAVLATVMTTTALGIGMDVHRGAEQPAELTDVPLMAAMFIALVWHGKRKLAAEQETQLISEENLRVLRTQRRFLQDASHQLRTPITIALGHAELLAGTITDDEQGKDIQVVLGELNRLRRIAERLLVIAAAEDPEFLRSELVSLDVLTMELIRRWWPTAERHWQIGRLDRVTVLADKERLSLALDALFENAVRHTGPDDVIKLSVIRGWPDQPVRMIVADSGTGIPQDQLHLIFNRFSTGDDRRYSGTGLGLALVRAVAQAHGGSVRVHSTPGDGSEFELLLPPPTPDLSELVADTPVPSQPAEQQGSARK